MKKPTKESIRRDLAPILPKIYQAFEHGIFMSRTYFESEDLKVDHFLQSTLVRVHVKAILRDKGVDDIVIYDTALCGLSFSYKHFHIRMWKSSDNELPPPGHSQRKQWFYTQQYTLPFPSAETFIQKNEHNSVESNSHLNIAILWNLNREYDFKLWVTCPKSFDAISGEIEVEWEPFEIKDPTLEIKTTKRPARPPVDLPISRKVGKAMKKAT